MFSHSIRVDTTKLRQLISEHPEKADDKLGALALDGERYVKQSFGSSPSAPGEPPGVDTGKLRAGMNAKKVRSLRWSINTGDTEYAVHLEYGTHRMAARPFMAPLQTWLEQQLREQFDKYLED